MPKRPRASSFKEGGKREEEKELKGESDSEDDLLAPRKMAGGRRGGGEGGSGEGRAERVKNEEEGRGERVKNKQRLLLLCSRGITHRFRHLMGDLSKLLPHGAKEAKLESKDRPNTINEIAEIRGCNGAVYFEARKHKDLYMWIARTPNGPSAKFLVQSIHTAAELKFTGNHLLFSRPFLVFDSAFDSLPHLQLLKEMLQQTFGTPKGHRKSKPFVDHTICFYYLDGHIWFRNYQIAKTEATGETALVEVGPRFCLNLHRIFAGAFEGATLYSNSDYVSPNVVRAREKLAKSTKYQARTEAQKESILRKQTMPKPQNPFAGVFK